MHILGFIAEGKVMKRYRMLLASVTLFSGLLVLQLAVQAADTRTVDTVSVGMKMVSVA